MRLHSWRHRKTGPAFPLAILCCREHGRYFTVYPPGFAPYLRTSLDWPRPAPGPTVALDPQALAASCFAAAILAAADARWPREGSGWPSWRTQQRMVASAARLLGLTTSEVCEPLRLALGAPIGAHVQARRRFAQFLWRDRAAGVVDTLGALDDAGEPVARLVVAGQIVGRWGRALVVDASFNLLRLRF